MSSDEAVISVRNVSKCFKMYEKPVHRLFDTLTIGKKTFHKEFWALQKVDFEIKKGESIGIVGRNGAGKSTLLQIITGILQPTSGNISLNGRVAALLELGSGFNPEFSGQENVYMNAAVLGFSEKETDNLYNEIVEFANIGDFIDQPVKHYSSGMMLRLAFAVQVMVKPDILIVDEAMAVGDALFQKKCFGKMMELQENGTSLVLVSHDVFTIKQFCEKAILLEKGKMLMSGESQEVTSEYHKLLFPSGNFENENSENNNNDDSGRGSKVNSGKFEELKEKDVEKRNETVLSFYPENPSWGCGGTELTSVKLYGCKPGGVFHGGETLSFVMNFKFFPDVINKIIGEDRVEPQYLFGIQVETAKAILLGGLTNVYEDFQNMKMDIESTTKITIKINAQMPFLFGGNYYFSPGVAIGTENRHTPLVRYDNLIVLKCEPVERFSGLLKFKFNMMKI